jgi:S-adenosylmethionine decarboxylase
MRKTIQVTKQMGGFGPHLTLDLSGCPMEPLVDYEKLYDLLNNLPGHIGMTKMTLPYVVKWLDNGAKVPGYSGFVMIAESHISFHTFPEKNFVFIDFFSCKQFDTDKAVDYLVKFFRPTQIEKNLVMRGKYFEKNGDALF